MALGPVTEYVLEKAPCRVLMTAPPEDGGTDEEPPGQAGPDGAPATSVPESAD